MACETFCLDTDDTYSSASFAGETLTIDTVRLVPVNESVPVDRQLGKYHNKTTVVGKTKRKPLNLHRHLDSAVSVARSTILVEMTVNDVHYQPGDHVGIFPANRKEIVDGILERLSGVDDFDEVLQLQLLKENHSTNGKLQIFFSRSLQLLCLQKVVRFSPLSPYLTLWICIWIWENRCHKKLGTTRKVTNLFVTNITNSIFGHYNTADAATVNTFSIVL